MGKKTYLINGHYYILDDDTGEIKEIIVKEGPEIFDPFQEYSSFYAGLKTSFPKKTHFCSL